MPRHLRLLPPVERAPGRAYRRRLMREDVGVLLVGVVLGAALFGALQLALGALGL